MRELYCTAVPKNHTIDARRLHLARRHTEAVGLCVTCDVLGGTPSELHECFACMDEAAAAALDESRCCLRVGDRDAGTRVSAPALPALARW